MSTLSPFRLASFNTLSRGGAQLIVGVMFTPKYSESSVWGCRSAIVIYFGHLQPLLEHLHQFTLSLPFLRAWPHSIPVTVRFLTFTAIDHLTNTSTCSTCFAKSVVDMAAANMTYAYADALVLWLALPHMDLHMRHAGSCSGKHIYSLCVLILKSRGSMKIKKRNKDKVSPCVVPVSILIGPVSAKNEP